METGRMPLATYNRKRDFKRTAEPKGKAARGGSSLIFVVQKHAATRLHYDFRLELDGVLKSWAVPKGPSLNPKDKHLAVMVEDHPYRYKDFEGTIPEGNYGAGNVIVWDKGTYHAEGASTKAESTKLLRAGLRKGHLSFVLEGTRLKGAFNLIEMRGRGKNQWLLIKKDDPSATSKDILRKTRSVVSGATLDVSSSAARRRGNTAEMSASRRRASIKKLKPMLAKIRKDPFDDAEWVFEDKYDGYRALAIVDEGKVTLYSRNLLLFNARFAPIANALMKLPHRALIDGEIVIEDARHVSRFQLLQNYQSTHKGTLKYYVFDLLHLDGVDLLDRTLLERKELLRLMLAQTPMRGVYFAQHLAGKGTTFYAKGVKKRMEGIMAKHSQSRYLPGSRSSQWLKIKINQEEEAIIVGITRPKGSRGHFGALVLAAYRHGALVYVGNCGTGFSQSTLKKLHGEFQKYFSDTPVLRDRAIGAGPIQWIRPHFVCQVKFTEWTDDGRMRHPVFLGLRIDKTPKEVVLRRN